MKTAGWFHAFYVAMWCASCLSTSLLLTRYLLLKMRICQGSVIIISGPCEIIGDQFARLLIFSALSLISLSLVFFVRVLFFRPVRVFEVGLSCGTWVLALWFYSMISTS